MKTGKNIKTKFRYVRKKASQSEIAKKISNKDIFVGQMINTVEALSKLAVNKEGDLIAMGVAHGKRRTEEKKDTLE